MGADDLVPVSGNEHIPDATEPNGSTVIENGSADNSTNPTAAAMQQMETSEPTETQGTWVYQARKLYENVPTHVRHILLGIGVLLVLIIAAVIGIVIHKELNHPERGFVEIFTESGRNFTMEVWIDGNTVEFIVPAIPSFSPSTRTVHDYDLGISVTQVEMQQVCFIYVPDVDKSPSIDDIRTAVLDSWPRGVDVSIGARKYVIWHGHLRRHNVLNLPDRVNNYYCDNGHYEMDRPQNSSGIPTLPPPPSSTSPPPPIIRAVAKSHPATCKKSCFPRFGVQNKLIILEHVDCVYYGNCVFRQE